MDDKKIDELINKALQEDLALPEGLCRKAGNDKSTPSPRRDISPSLTKTFLLLDKRNRRRYSWRPIPHLHGDKSSGSRYGRYLYRS